jgi:uncharacterized protein YodC (DUF2158 family)
MANTFKVGDAVMLKVGGPAMSVSKVIASVRGEGTTYRCQWFAGKKLDSGDFPPESLMAVQPAISTSTSN